MPIKNVEELFLTVLSDVRAREERSLQAWQEMSQHAQDEDVKKVLETRAFLTKESISNLDECFRLLGKQPMQPTTRLHDVFIEDFRRELNEIHDPTLRSLYVIHKARELAQLHVSAYVGLITMAELMGNIPVSALLETNLAGKMVFIDRAADLVHEIGESAVMGRMRKAA